VNATGTGITVSMPKWVTSKPIDSASASPAALLVGAGFVGLEVAAAARAHGRQLQARACHCRRRGERPHPTDQLQY
jgi:NADPH-dependent 2,4-dienoyl-CoA reductase/sulfur reductase-like enzyme